MTREEQTLNGFTEMMRGFWNNQNLKVPNKVENKGMTVKALERESSEDCISRQAVLDLCDKKTKYDIPYEYYEGKKHIKGWDEGKIINFTKLMQLPPVSPQSRKVWITTYWTKGIEPVVTPFDNQEAAETCARYYEKRGCRVCIDECNIFHKCTDTKNEE